MLNGAQGLGEIMSQLVGQGTTMYKVARELVAEQQPAPSTNGAAARLARRFAGGLAVLHRLVSVRDGYGLHPEEGRTAAALVRHRMKA